MKIVKSLGLAALVAATPSIAAVHEFNQVETASGAFAIPDLNIANPKVLHLTFDVQGLGAINDVNLTLTGLSHNYAGDVGVALFGPNGAGRVLLMTDVGGWSNFLNTNITFDQQAAGSLPFLPGSSSYNMTGSLTAKPTTYTVSPVSWLNWLSTDSSSLNYFNGKDPNGTWNLYVYDDKWTTTGSLVSAKLTLDAAALPAAPVPEPATWAMMIGGLGLVGMQMRRRRRAVSFA